MLMFIDDAVDEASTAVAVPLGITIVGDIAVIEGMSIVTDVKSNF